MANPIIKIKRGATAPVATLSAGEFAIDQAAKNLYLGVEVGGVTTNEIVGGSGTFATKQFVTDAVNAGTGNLGTMSTQNANAVSISGGMLDSVDVYATTLYAYDGMTSEGDINMNDVGSIKNLIAPVDANDAVRKTDLDTAISALGTISTQNADSVAITGGAVDGTTIGATTASSGKFTTLTASSAPSASNDVVRKTDLDARISSLGTIFKYIGTLDGGVDEASAYDLSVLDVGGGEFYRVATAGFFAGAGSPHFYANQGDGILFDSDGVSERIDNTNTQVAGTANEIVVSGSTDTGYTVAIDSAFKTRVSDVETKTQNIDLADTTAGVTRIGGDVVFGDGLSENFKVASDGTVSINGNTNRQTWHGYGTLDINAGGGAYTAGGKDIGVQTNGALVCNNETPMPIEGFIIDGGVY